MNEYTTNQPIGSTISNHDITHRLHNGQCLDCPIFSTESNPPNMTGGNSGTLTPLGKALQNKCPRCDMRWIIHNCPQYPKLLDAKEMIKKLARGAVLREFAENADYFTSIKQDGEEFNVYISLSKTKINFR